MVGLSVVLEAQKGSSVSSKKTPQVINKTTMLSSSSINKQHSSSSSSSFSSSAVSVSQHSPFQEAKFLDQCFLCRKRLLPGKDIYMYKGDRAFCSVECRCKQIFMDEEDSIIQKDKCSSFTSSSSETRPHHQKGTTN